MIVRWLESFLSGTHLSDLCLCGNSDFLSTLMFQNRGNLFFTVSTYWNSLYPRSWTWLENYNGNAQHLIDGKFCPHVKPAQPYAWTLLGLKICPKIHVCTNEAIGRNWFMRRCAPSLVTPSFKVFFWMTQLWSCAACLLWLLIHINSWFHCNPFVQHVLLHGITVSNILASSLSITNILMRSQDSLDTHERWNKGVGKIYKWCYVIFCLQGIIWVTSDFDRREPENKVTLPNFLYAAETSLQWTILKRQWHKGSVSVKFLQIVKCALLGEKYMNHNIPCNPTQWFSTSELESDVSIYQQVSIIKLNLDTRCCHMRRSFIHEKYIAWQDRYDR